VSFRLRPNREQRQTGRLARKRIGVDGARPGRPSESDQSLRARQIYLPRRGRCFWQVPWKRDSKQSERTRPNRERSRTGGPLCERVAKNSGNTILPRQENLTVQANPLGRTK